MSEWVGEKKWKRLADSTKREWKGTYWEHGLKRQFDGADRELGLRLPVEFVVKQSLKFKIFSRGGRNPKPQIRDHRLQLQRCENFLAFSIQILICKNRADITTVFDSSVNQIVALVMDQIQKTRQRVRSLPKVSLIRGRNDRCWLNASRQSCLLVVSVKVPIYTLVFKKKFSVKALRFENRQKNEHPKIL
jgi:hypothetical protein